MARLEDFSSDSANITLEELAPVKDNTVVNNPPSNRNLAAFSAGIGNPEQLESHYRNVVSETEEDLSSSTSQGILEEATQQNREGATKALSDYLALPDVPIEAKQHAIDGFEAQVAESNKTQNIFARKYAMEDSKGETAEADKVRTLSSQAWELANDYNQKMQEALNSEESKFDSSLSEDLGALVEIMIPFTESVNFAEISRELKGRKEGEDLGEFTLNTLLAGSAKAEIRDAFMEMDLEDRLAFTETLINIVNKHSGIVLSDSNKFANMEYLRSVLDSGYYDDGDEFMDNIFSILDSTIIGGLGVRTIKGFGQGLGLLSDAVKGRRVRSAVQPSTPSQTLKEVNPDHSRDTFEASSMNDEIAQAAYGTNSTEVVANDLLPEFGEVIRNKVGNINSKGDGPAIKDQNVSEFLNNNDGAIYLTAAEKKNAVQNVTNDFRNAKGFTVRNEMSSSHVDGNDLTLRSVFGPEEGGFLNPQDAIESFLFNMRHTGVTKDDVVLLKNVQGNRVPVSNSTVDEGDYLISIDTHHKLSENVTEYDSLDVKNNFLERLSIGSGKVGTLQSHLVDAHSSLHPNITLGSSVQVDKSVGLESVLSESTKVFQTGYAKLPKERRLAVENFIKDANDRGLDFNTNEMIAAGLNKGEQNILKNWREFWDAHYWLENGDLVKTLRQRGFRVFEDGSEKHFARPRSKANFKNSVNVYDSSQNKIIHMSLNDVESLYDSGGTLAEFRRPLVDGKDKADYIMSLEKQDGPYLRGIADSDQVITYRKGYYQVHYDKPVFIDRILKDNRGNVISKRAVATSGNIKDAEFQVNRLSATDPDGAEYVARPDNKKMRLDGDDSWDLQVGAGRSAQRHRGDRLEHSVGSFNPSDSNILDPMEALVRSTRSVSKRVSMRDYLENSKARFLQQYSDMLPKDDFGQPRFPDNRSQIGVGKFLDGDVSDAVTTFEYLRYMEDGWVNSIDDSYKALMNNMADTLGRFSSTGETLVRSLGEANPTQLAKSSTFKMYLAANPLRQWVVQGHQMARLTALFPGQMLSGKLSNQMALLSAEISGLPTPKLWLKTAGMSKAELTQMAKDWRASGLPQAVDSNNLVRGDLRKLADVSAGDKAKSLINSPFKLGQRIGFDPGEDINIKSAWLAYRNDALSKGKSLTSDVRDDISARARNITYNMNAAGDLPYNQNFLNVALQYVQVPHKALTQNWFNRNLSKSEKAKLIVQDTVMWGLPTATITAIFGEVLPEDPEVRNKLEAGLEDVMLNAILTETLGQDVGINFNDSLSPGNIHGIGEVVKEILTGDIGGIISESPAGQLFFGGNPRLTNLAKTAARYTNFIDDYEDPTEFSQVAMATGQTMSGMSNAWKAMYALKYGQKINSLYDISDYEVNSAEAVAQAFGFRTWDEVQKQSVKKELYDQKFLKNDIRTWYNEFKIHLGRKGITDQELDYTVRVFNEALRVYGTSNQEVSDEIKKLVTRDIKNNDDVLFKSILRKSGVIDADTLRRIAEDSGLEDDQRQALIDAIDVIESYRTPK